MGHELQVEVLLCIACSCLTPLRDKEREFFKPLRGYNKNHIRVEIVVQLRLRERSEMLGVL